MYFATNREVDIHKYSNSLLKHMPEKTLKTYENTLLYSKKPVTLTDNRDRRLHTRHDKKTKSDPNLNKIRDITNQKPVYSIPLRYLIDIGLANFPESFSARFFFILEDNYSKLFESKAKITTAIPKPNAEIYFHGTPYISYPQIKLDENFEVYFNSSLRSKIFLKTVIQMTPYEWSFEINTGTQSVNVNFIGSNRQFSFLEISFVYDKSDQHQTIFDSYDV